MQILSVCKLLSIKKKNGLLITRMTYNIFFGETLTLSHWIFSYSLDVILLFPRGQISFRVQHQKEDIRQR